MSLPPPRPKFGCVYTDDNGSKLYYLHCQDIITLGVFTTGGSAQRAAGPGVFKPRAIHMLSTDGTRRFTVPIASRGAWVGYQSGSPVTYGGVACLITGKRGEISRG